MWPCYFFKSDTTGEKDFEEFFTDRETLDLARFASVGVIKNEPVFDAERLQHFLTTIECIRSQPTWDKTPLVDLFNQMIADFSHKETGKYLDSRM